MSVLIVCQAPLNSLEPVDWWSRGQEVPPRLFIFQYVSQEQAGSRAFEGAMAGREEAKCPSDMQSVMLSAVSALCFPLHCTPWLRRGLRMGCR